VSDGGVPGRVAIIWRGLCPRCRAGRIFSGALRMNDRCPSCGIPFSREPGYFSGAMYFSYVLGVGLILVLLAGLFFLLRGWPVTRLFLVAAILFLPFIPAVFRYSRILWIHFDRHFEP